MDSLFFFGRRMKSQKIKKLLIIVFLFIISISAVFAQTLGDANSDGSINIIDALVTAQYSVGINVSINTANADVNKNGQAEITDALLIAQYSVGIITVFPGQNTTPTPTGTGTLKAEFTISKTMPALNENVTFNASGSTGPITSYNWDFGDGTTATGVTVTHAFTIPDDYKVALTVKDSGSQSNKVTKRVFAGRPQGWTQATHSKSGDADYNLLFPEDKVHRIDITISPGNFQIMEDNLKTLNMMSNENPIYVAAATVKFNNVTWWNVGIRYKGQSTLFTPQSSRKHKYPFRLDFDEFEDTYPEIKDQRFYGFKKMIFSNNWYDATFVRDKVYGDIVRSAGIPAARNAFCRVYIDTGSGPVYWGLYTMTEDPSDQMLKTQFTNADGNLYKGQTVMSGFTSINGDLKSPLNKKGYEKKTNEDADDWSDLNAVITALNASRTNAAAWRTNLEAVFDVQSFLKWLAINTAIVNFDTYGWVAKNNYWYQLLDQNGKMMYIPYDFNLSLNMNPLAGITIPSLSLSEITNAWPLIRYLMDDTTYNQIYHQEMRTAMDGCFNETAVKAKITQLHELIKPYVVGADGETNTTYSYLTNGSTEFESAHTSLLNHITNRQTTVRNYLSTVPQ